MNFEFATAHRIIFGAGTLREGAKAISEIGRRALVVTGQNTSRVEGLLNLLVERGVSITTFSTRGEPTIDGVQLGAEVARRSSAQVVIGFGGGSVMDAAKAIAAFSTNTRDPFDHLEVVGKGLPLENPPLPSVAIPTTAGSGAEVTRNAVLLSPTHRVKVSLRSPLLLPRLAIVDPELTYQLPRSITAASGMDAFTQLIEAFLSIRANPFTDALCRSALPKAAAALRTLARGNLHDRAAREDMAYASLCSGLALANAGLGVIHGFAAPLGGMFGAPHGEVCAALLAPALEVNLRALRARDHESPALDRFAEISELTSSGEWHDADWIIQFARELTAAFGIRSLGAMGVPKNERDALINAARSASSMRGNPVALTPAELEEIFENAW